MKAPPAAAPPPPLQIETGRISKQLVQLVGPSGADFVQYLGGVAVHYVYIPFPAPLFSGITKQQSERRHGVGLPSGLP